MKPNMTPDGQEGSDDKLEFGSIESDTAQSRKESPTDSDIKASRARRSPAEIQRDFAYADLPEVKTVSDEVDSGKIHTGAAQNPRRLDH